MKRLSSLKKNGMSKIKQNSHQQEILQLLIISKLLSYCSKLTSPLPLRQKFHILTATELYQTELLYLIYLPKIYPSSKSLCCQRPYLQTAALICGSLYFVTNRLIVYPNIHKMFLKTLDKMMYNKSYYAVVLDKCDKIPQSVSQNIKEIELWQRKDPAIIRFMK